ncbi:acetyl-CoA synthetase-like protein [Backusella circina FSU 941]|nr:acetyl-CoA synthetase-like protein [Backusella circina FSU 941]
MDHIKKKKKKKRVREYNPHYFKKKTGLKISKDRPCLGTRSIKNPHTGERGAYVWQTYRQTSHRITNFGSGLINYLEQSNTNTRQTPIAIWGVNRPEWTIADLACAAYGMYSVALYDTLGPDTAEYIINQAEITTVVCSADHIADLLKLKHKLPQLTTIISMDTLDEPKKAGVASKSDIVKAWAAEKGVHLIDFASLEESGKKNRRQYMPCGPEDLLCIMYTSGTTGMPKGVMLTHRNFVSSMKAGETLYDSKADDSCISYLPLAHIYGRICEMILFMVGGRVGYSSGDVSLIVEDIQELKPTNFPSVPRLLNRVYAKIAASTIEAPGVTGALARHAVAVKLANLEAGKGYTHPFWDRLIFNKVKKALGGNVRLIATGSAPIGRDVMQFLRVVLCCDIREGYGATETCAAVTIHLPKEYKADHVGTPLSCCEYKLVDVPEMEYLSTDPFPRGEVCVRGHNVFTGYFKEPEKTREALDEEGWYHTGDIGRIDERGCLVIIDRKKNIFKLAQGEYIAPEKIENIYMKYSAIGQIYVHGDSIQSSLVAIIVPDPEALPAVVAERYPELKEKSYAELCKEPEVVQMILGEMNRMGKKAGLHGFELVRAIYLESEPFSVENELLTPTFKVKRNQAAKHYRQMIEDLYNKIPDAKAKL